MKISCQNNSCYCDIIVSGLIFFLPFSKWAKAHVNEKTGVNDHPLLCTSCHLYISKNPVISKLVNAEYLSPINLAAFQWINLYVVAQDDNSLLVVDPEKGKVLKRFAVGNHPHSVVIDKAGKTAYVSNQWSDDVSVIDLLQLHKVTDTLKTGAVLPVLHSARWNSFFMP